MIELAIAIALGLLFVWARDRWHTLEARRLERELNCPHRPEWQQMIRVNRLSMGGFVPGARWAVKHCRGCGRQRHLYGPTLQPWADFEREWHQETIDREAEFRARKHQHDIERGQHEKDRVHSPDRSDRGAGAAP